MDSRSLALVVCRDGVDPVSVACPECLAAVGEPCHIGRERRERPKPHDKRILAADPAVQDFLFYGGISSEDAASLRFDPLIRFLAYSGSAPTGNGCIEWSGPLDGNGYGAFRCGKTTYKAHRISLGFHGRSLVPMHLYALHSCDNPACVNPNHLRAGTARENRMDAISRGRTIEQYRHSDVCLRGHSMSGENVRIRSNGRLRCLSCARLYKSAEWVRAPKGRAG